MRASDTVIRGEEARKAYLSGKTVERQAEISFKAGIKEVVEWIEENSSHDKEEEGSLSWFIRDMWQAKLKEWGIGS